jgi:hypothetical protein
MIELVRITVAGDRTLDLAFCDGCTARWSADAIILRNTILTRPLEDPAFFRRAFIESGALAWPNGLEFSARSLHEKLSAAGALVRKAA